MTVLECICKSTANELVKFVLQHKVQTDIKITPAGSGLLSENVGLAGAIQCLKFTQTLVELPNVSVIKKFWGYKGAFTIMLFKIIQHNYPINIRCAGFVVVSPHIEKWTVT